jgi:YbbR domain-containing protein
MRLVPRNPGMFVLALVLACLVWYANALDRRERISERQLDASLTLVNVPTDMVITSEVPRFLSLRVRGPLNRLRSLDPAQTGVVLDLRGAGEGEREFPVEARSVVVPSGVEVLAVSPSAVPLRLERLVRRQVPIKPQLVGGPAAGMMVTAVGVAPADAVISGPRLQLEALAGVSTEAVNIQGADGAVAALVAVRSPNPLMRIVEPLTVRVTVEIAKGHVETKGGKRR